MCGLLERTGAEAAAGVTGVAGGAGVVGVAGEDNNAGSPGVGAGCVAAGMGKGGMGGIGIPGVMGVDIGITGGGGIIDIIEGRGGIICDPIADPIGIFCLEFKVIGTAVGTDLPAKAAGTPALRAVLGPFWLLPLEAPALGALVLLALPGRGAFGSRMKGDFGMDDFGVVPRKTSGMPGELELDSGSVGQAGPGGALESKPLCHKKFRSCGPSAGRSSVLKGTSCLSTLIPSNTSWT